MIVNELARRRFLRFLLTSPVLAQTTGLIEALGQNSAQIPNQAFNVLDFEAAARAGLPPAHFGYLATAAAMMPRSLSDAEWTA